MRKTVEVTMLYNAAFSGTGSNRSFNGQILSEDFGE